MIPVQKRIGKSIPSNILFHPMRLYRAERRILPSPACGFGGLRCGGSPVRQCRISHQVTDDRIRGENLRIFFVFPSIFQQKISIFSKIIHIFSNFVYFLFVIL